MTWLVKAPPEQRGVIRPFSRAVQFCVWLETRPGWTDRVPFEIGLMPMKLIKMNRLERDRESREVRACWAQDRGSSANIMTHLFFLIAKPELCHLFTSSHVHRLMWKITSVIQVDRFMCVSVCVCLWIHISKLAVLRFVTVKCPRIYPSWGKLGKGSKWAHKGTTMGRSVAVCSFFCLYVIHKWHFENYCCCF